MSILLSPKHGVNPTITVCFFCGKEKNEILLLGKIKGDAEAPHHAIFNQEPCDECKKLMALGVMLISVKDGSDHENPYRTGKVCVITIETAQKIFNNIGNERAAFVEDSVWDKILSTKNID